MIATLPMYDRPETAAANDRLWGLFREAYGDGPNALSRGGDLWEMWQSDNLLLAQTCGFPYRSRLKDRVTLVGSPDLALEGLPAGYYASVIVAHPRFEGAGLSALSDATFAYNEPMSQSGWAAPWHHFTQQDVRIGDRIQSGAHRKSAQMVAEGKADYAALDIVSWKMMQRYDAFSGKLVEVARTMPTPALPYITARYQKPAPIRNALHAAIEALSALERDTLLLQGLVALPQSAYEAVPNPPKP
ncbi:phosphate/phosphite/phosphonate ABC transporter substrate-binding protein [Shimia sp.]|uniref:phosphate/phosphite/phosphonate ABC transporter substrate-binding protein n=1 Tax=Shimia sp. TaxID=1954381 RepID=UPI003B8E4B00